MSIKVNFFGDFCPIGRLEKVLTDDMAWLGDLTEWVGKADLNIFDLECPITESEVRLKKSGPHLKAKPDRIELIKNAGLNMAALANNHILDYGPEGLLETINLLDKYKIEYVGAGPTPEQCPSPRIIKIKGKIIGIINFTHTEFTTATCNQIGANGLDIIDNYTQIKNVKANCDYLFVIVHAGIEMYQYPSPHLQKLCRFFSSLGVTSVICHHSHIIGCYEIFEGVPIFYGLGNFLLDIPVQSDEFRKGLTVQFNLVDDGYTFDWFAFEYNPLNDIILKRIDSFNLKEVSCKEVNKQWEKMQQDNARARHAINTFRGTGRISKLISRFIPEWTWKGISLQTLLMLRNEFNYEFLISILEKRLNNRKDQ